MFVNRYLRLALLGLVGLVIVAVVAWWQVQGTRTMAPAARIGGPFQLTDHTGQTVTDAKFRGRQLLIYFGYTYCPDVCPTELAAMTQALDRLGPAADKIQPLFISIDPERDNPSHLADFVGLFHPRLVGLTGTAEQVAAVARAYRVYYAKAASKEGGTTGGKDYLMDHSSFIYWMDEEGGFIAVFSAGTAPDAIAERLKSRQPQ